MPSPQLAPNPPPPPSYHSLCVQSSFLISHFVFRLSVYQVKPACPSWRGVELIEGLHSFFTKTTNSDVPTGDNCKSVKIFLSVVTAPSKYLSPMSVVTNRWEFTCNSKSFTKKTYWTKKSSDSVPLSRCYKFTLNRENCWSIIIWAQIPMSSAAEWLHKTKSSAVR